MPSLWQNVLVLAIVAAACLYLARKLVRTFSRPKSGACGACASCPASKSDGSVDAQTPALVTLQSFSVGKLPNESR